MSRLTGKRILVVDDDPDVRALTSRVLRDKGFATSEASEGGAALELLAAEAPDLVVLDIDMSGLDGWGFLEFLPEGAPPVVFLSGNLGFDSFARGARAGVAAFVGKPIHYRRLVTTCRRILETPRASPEHEERRRSERRQLLVKVGMLSKLGTPQIIGELTDLSAGGARVITVGPVEVGSKVRFALDAAVAGELLRFDCLVRWCAPVEDGYAHGLAFTDLAPEARQALRNVLGERVP